MRSTPQGPLRGNPKTGQELCGVSRLVPVQNIRPVDALVDQQTRRRHTRSEQQHAIGNILTQRSAQRLAGNRTHRPQEIVRRTSDRREDIAQKTFAVGSIGTSPDNESIGCLLIREQHLARCTREKGRNGLRIRCRGRRSTCGRLRLGHVRRAARTAGTTCQRTHQRKAGHESDVPVPRLGTPVPERRHSVPAKFVPSCDGTTFAISGPLGFDRSSSGDRNADSTPCVKQRVHRLRSVH